MVVALVDEVTGGAQVAPDWGAGFRLRRSPEAMQHLMHEDGCKTFAL